MCPPPSHNVMEKLKVGVLDFENFSLPAGKVERDLCDPTSTPWSQRHGNWMLDFKHMDATQRATQRQGHCRFIYIPESAHRSLHSPYRSWWSSVWARSEITLVNILVKISGLGVAGVWSQITGQVRYCCSRNIPSQIFGPDPNSEIVEPAMYWSLCASVCCTNKERRDHFPLVKF